MKKAMFLLLVYITYIQGYEMYEAICQQKHYSNGGYTLSECRFSGNYPGHLIKSKKDVVFKIVNAVNVIEVDLK